MTRKEMRPPSVCTSASKTKNIVLSINHENKVMMNYEYDKENSVIHLKASGVLKPSDPINYFKAIDKDPAFTPKAEERIYFTDLDDIEFKFTDVLAIRNAFELYRHGDKISHGIFIVDSTLSLGMANMVITLFDDVFDKFTIQKLSGKEHE